MQDNFNTRAYWNNRYNKGGHSGAGSYGKLRDFKVQFINAFIKTAGVSSLIDMGCGDGSVASGLEVRSYTGVDVSMRALELCKAKRSNLEDAFFMFDDFLYEDNAGSFDLALSMDVIFHLVEDDVFEKYMYNLFTVAGKYVIIYSSDREEDGTSPSHLRHRKFSEYIRSNLPHWELSTVVNNKYPFKGEHDQQSFSDFFLYVKKDARSYR